MAFTLAGDSQAECEPSLPGRCPAWTVLCLRSRDPPLRELAVSRKAALQPGRLAWAGAAATHKRLLEPQDVTPRPGLSPRHASPHVHRSVCDKLTTGAGVARCDYEA